MKILFHIGMGKTGTTSIQRAMRSNLKALEAQGVSYLGMLFDFVEPKYNAPNGIPVFFREPPAKQVENAKLFMDFLSRQAEQKNIQKFIFSNESIYEMADLGVPFFDELNKYLEVSFLAYIREPASWLPSAYAQWGLRHKKDPGPIKSFNELSDGLIRMYRHTKTWHQRWGENIKFRKFDKNIDSVADFASAADIELPIPAKRAYQRDSAAESVLRAAFNNRFEAPVIPNRFTETVYNSDAKPAINLRNFVNRSFDYSSLEQTIEKNKDIFQYLNDVINLNIEYKNIAAPKVQEFEEIKEGLIDYLVAIMLDQSFKIAKLEKVVAMLQEENK